MAEIVETLIHQNAAGGDERFNFTVNLAAVDVLLNVVPAMQPPFLRPSVKTSPYFQPADGIRLLSCGLWLPYHFAISVVPVKVMLFWRYAIGIEVPLLGNFLDSTLWVPMESYEYAIDKYAPFPMVPATTKAGLVAYLMDPNLGAADDRLRISMQGVPAPLDGTTQSIRFWVKVMHNLPLVA